MDSDVLVTLAGTGPEIPGSNMSPQTKGIQVPDISSQGEILEFLHELIRPNQDSIQGLISFNAFLHIQTNVSGATHTARNHMVSTVISRAGKLV